MQGDAGPGDAITPLLDRVNRNRGGSNSIRRAARFEVRTDARMVSSAIPSSAKMASMRGMPVSQENVAGHQDYRLTESGSRFPHSLDECALLVNGVRAGPKTATGGQRADPGLA
jgi:hypothetical protein